MSFVCWIIFCGTACTQTLGTTDCIHYFSSDLEGKVTVVRCGLGVCGLVGADGRGGE